MEERMLYFIMALALVLCMALPMAAPAVADENGIGGYKDTVWEPADGHPDRVYLIGQTVYYSLQIRNNSPTYNMTVTISDKVPVEPHTYAEIPGVTTTYWWNNVTDDWDGTAPGTTVTIAPSGSWDGTFNHTINEDDVRVHPIEGYNVTVNRVFANGTQWVNFVHWADAAEVWVIHPAIKLVKAVDPEEAQVGQNVTYTFNISNTGDWPLEDINLDDDVLGDLTGELPPNLVLNATGEAGDCYSFAYNYTIKTGDLPLENEATVEGTAQGFNATIFPDAAVSDIDTAEVILKSEVGIEIKKYVSDNATGPWDDAQSEPGPEYIEGSDVCFKFVVINTGNVELTDVTVSDTDFDLSGWTIPDLAPSGEPGDSAEYVHGPVTAISGQHSNNATATGKPPSGPDVSDYDLAHYFGLGPGIEIKKYVSDNATGPWDDAESETGPVYAEGSDVCFKFVVTNTGNVTLTGVNASDTDFDLSAWAIPDLAPSGEPGDSAEYVHGPVTAIKGQHSNTATASGKPPVGDDVSDTDMAHYLGLGPDIDIEKRTNGQDADSEPGPYITIGNTITWTYIVRNIGGVNLTDVVVTDDKLGLIGTIPSLPVDGTVTLHESGIAEAGQYGNVGSATGIPPFGDPVTDDDPSHYFGRNVTAPVGWETYPVNKVRVMLPWIILLAAVVAGASLLVLRHRRVTL